MNARSFHPSRFDVYLAGEENALSSKEPKRPRTFHQKRLRPAAITAPALAAQIFKNFGVYEDYWKETAALQIDKRPRRC